MKNLFLPIVFVFSSLHIYAQQSVGIGTSSPQASALLDITSTTKGLLIPRMTYSQKNAIQSPASGLMVFQTNASGTNQSGLYYYDGSLWKRFARYDEIGGGGNNSWTITGDNQYSNLTGNVGIGTTNPTSKFHVVGSVLQEGSTYALNHSSGILQFRNSGVNKAYVQLSGQNLRMGTNAGNSAGGIVFRLDGTERMVIDSSGDVGIGTESPDTRLHVYGGIVKVERPGTALGVPLSPIVSFEISDENDKKGGFTFSRSGTILSKLLYVNRTSGANVFRFGMSDPEAFDLTITDNARVGINMNSVASSYEGQLHVRGASGVDEIALVKSVMGQSPTIQFHSTTSSGLPDAKEAFIQLDNGDDLRLGTNGGNTTGKIVFRLNGADHVWINDEGEMGLGTEFPLAKLTIQDGQDADYNPSIGNGYLMMGNVGSTNLMLDNNEILARNDIGPSTLYVQQDGGLLKIGPGSAATGTKVQINGGTGSSLSSHGQMVLGDPSGTNMTMDINEIQARSNGNASTLYLQRSGGLLDISGHTTISKSGSGEVLRLDGTNPNIGFYQSGSYKSFLAQDGSDLFMGVNGGKIHLDGTQIAIGSINSNASTYKLTVSGKIICEELKVELYSNWPDYVFSDTYNLKPLHELKTFIEANKHLPNIPKADEVAKEGIEVGEMNRKLLEKIEELTLYVIDLQEQINDLKGEFKTEANNK